jgi:drug/metabolite transporter (DMT)-like permease
VPSFIHTDTSGQAQLVAIGFVLLFVSVSLFGIATVYFKLKVPNTDITVSSFIQTGTSFLFDIIWSLIMDGPAKIKQCCTEATAMDWIWPLLLGVIASGLAVHCFMYLVNNLGAVGANFVPFGQIVVGVILGVAWLKEWKAYRPWEIGISCLGIAMLIGAIVIGFWHEKRPPQIPDEEESASEEEEHRHAHLDEI